MTPLSGLALARALNAGAHQLVHPVTGDGTTGEALVRSGVDKISFTGSPLTGRRIMAAAAETLTPVVMELGGKDPMIVCDDADIRRAAKAAAAGAFGNAGQTCIAVERVFGTPGAYEPFLEEALRATARIRQGWGPGNHIGAITRPGQIEVIEQRIRDAQSRGARVLTGGNRNSGPGAFFPPTIVADVNPDMEIMREETFGPVLPVMRVGTVEEALRLANDCDFGLNASVFTSNAELATRVAGELCTGGVSINQRRPHWCHDPLRPLRRREGLGLWPDLWRGGAVRVQPDQGRNRRHVQVLAQPGRVHDCQISAEPQRIVASGEGSLRRRVD